MLGDARTFSTEFQPTVNIIFSTAFMFSLTNKIPVSLSLMCFNCPKKSKRNLEENEYSLRVYIIMQYYCLKNCITTGSVFVKFIYRVDMLN